MSLDFSPERCFSTNELRGQFIDPAGSRLQALAEFSIISLKPVPSYQPPAVRLSSIMFLFRRPLLWFGAVLLFAGICPHALCQSISFRNDVMAVLSKAGCNQ